MAGYRHDYSMSNNGKLNKESRNPRGELVTSHEQVYLIF